MTLVAPLDFGSKCCYSMQTVNLGGYMLSVKDKVDWLREYAPSSIRCDAEGVWLDYQHNRITQRQAVIRLNNGSKQHTVNELILLWV